jgi:hypothetical protein
MEIERAAQETIYKVKRLTLIVVGVFALQLVIFLAYSRSGTKPSMTILGLNGFIYLGIVSLISRLAKNLGKVSKKQSTASIETLLFYLLNIVLLMASVILFLWLNFL